jgi:hypothetical protein
LFFFETTATDIILNLDTGQKLVYPFTLVIRQTDPNEWVYTKVAQSMAKQVCEGYNAICIAYGQTGCGKT